MNIINLAEYKSKYRKRWTGGLPLFSDQREISHHLFLRSLRSKADKNLFGIKPGDDKIAHYMKLVNAPEEYYDFWKYFVGTPPSHQILFGYDVDNKNAGIITRNLIDDSFNFALEGYDKDGLADITFEWLLNVAHRLPTRHRSFLLYNELSVKFWAKVLCQKQYATYASLV